MKFLDDEFLGDSKLTIQEKQKLQAVFDRVTSGDKSYKLHFRSAYIGPNAFALPNGDIVLLDDLVKLSQNKFDKLQSQEPLIAYAQDLWTQGLPHDRLWSAGSR